MESIFLSKSLKIGVCIFVATYFSAQRVLLLAAGQQILHWEEEHQHCSLHLPAASHLTSNQYTNGNPPSYSISSSMIQCEDLPYVDYFRELLKNSPSDYHHSFAEAILSMYTDLNDARQPQILSAEHIQKYLPNTHKAFVSNPSNRTQLMIYPVSFGVFAEDVVPQVQKFVVLLLQK